MPRNNVQYLILEVLKEGKKMRLADLTRAVMALGKFTSNEVNKVKPRVLWSVRGLIEKGYVAIENEGLIKNYFLSKKNEI